jgi:hypothetical protein
VSSLDSDAADRDQRRQHAQLWKVVPLPQAAPLDRVIAAPSGKTA